MTASRDLYLGVEIGATKQQISLSDADGQSLGLISEKVPLPNGAVDVMDWLLRSIPPLIARQTELGGEVRAIGAGFGGVLESRTGRIRISVQVPGWQDFPLKGWFESTFHLPTLIANDTVAGGYAELCRGSGQDARHFFYSNIGSGIGGALFLDRVPYDGLGMGAAYIGHTYVPDWTAAAPGCEDKLENLCSGWSIEKRLRTSGYVAAESALLAMCQGDVTRLTCTLLGEAARQGDAFAVAEIQRIARSYAIALSNVLTLLSPDVVALGGGVANLGDVLFDPIRRFTEERVFISVRGAYRIVPCAFMDAAVPTGAALLARDRCGSSSTGT
jgi:glucokinase